MSFAEYFFLISFAISLAVLFFILLPFLLFLKGKPMMLAEDELDNGKRFYSLNIVMAGQGALHYGSVFLFDWYAKRYHLLTLRENVPEQVRNWFKCYYLLFLASFLLAVLAICALYFAQ